MRKIISLIPEELDLRLNKVVKEQMSNRSVEVRLALKEYCDKILGDDKNDGRRAEIISKEKS